MGVVGNAFAENPLHVIIPRVEVELVNCPDVFVLTGEVKDIFTTALPCRKPGAVPCLEKSLQLEP